jgi:hypothetical protein
MSEAKPPASLDDLKTMHRNIGARIDALERKGEDKTDDAPMAAAEARAMMALLQRHIGQLGEGEGEEESEADDAPPRRRRRAQRKDDDNRKDDRGDDPEDPDRQGTDPKQTAADDDDRSPARRADAARAEAAREEAENEDNRYQAQGDFDKVFYALEGTRAPPPLAGERARTYRVRMLRQLQKYSPEHKDVDLAAIPDPKLFELTDRRIRADALGVAHDPAAMQRYFEAALPGLREVISEDPRTGRRVSKFYGPVEATLAPFRLPQMRAKFDQDVIRESKRRGAL